MPEGDIVWNTARLLDQALAGATVERSDLRIPRLATTDLAGWRVLGCASRGKHLLLRFARPTLANEVASTATSQSDSHVDGTSAGSYPSGSLTLHAHLRMDGSWRLFPAGQRPAMNHTVRVVLSTATVTAVGYHLHDLALVPTEEEARLVGHLGPDLLGEAWDPAEAVRRLRQQPHRTVAEALLDQTCLAGIGTLYRSEVLFLRGIHPSTRIRDIADLQAVVELARRLLHANRGRWAQSTTGSLRRGEQTYVYGRAGRPCRRCGTRIERSGGLDERVAFWCPRCQPAR